MNPPSKLGEASRSNPAFFRDENLNNPNSIKENRRNCNCADQFLGLCVCANRRRANAGCGQVTGYLCTWKWRTTVHISSDRAPDCVSINQFYCGQRHNTHGIVNSLLPLATHLVVRVRCCFSVSTFQAGQKRRLEKSWESFRTFRERSAISTTINIQINTLLTGITS